MTPDPLPDSSAVRDGSASAGPQTNQGGVVEIRGNPSPAELAAVLAVLGATLAAASTAGGPVPDPRPASSWASPAARLRTAYGTGRVGWRESGLPR